MATLKSASESTSDVLVLGLSSKAGKLSIHPNIQHISVVSHDLKKLLGILGDLGATGKVDEVVKVPFSGPKLVLFTGFGTTAATYSPETLRRAAGAATRALAGQAHADFALPIGTEADLAAVAEGVSLGAYSFTEFLGSSKASQKAPLKSATIISSLGNSASIKAALKRAEILGRHVATTRDLINTPPSHLTPITFSAQMKKTAASLGIKVEILNVCAAVFTFATLS